MNSSKANLHKPVSNQIPSANDRGENCFHFEDLIRNIDRQVETQTNPMKKFNLEDDMEAIDIEIELGNQAIATGGSPHG